MSIVRVTVEPYCCSIRHRCKKRVSIFFILVTFLRFLTFLFYFLYDFYLFCKRSLDFSVPQSTIKHFSGVWVVHLQPGNLPLDFSVPQSTIKHFSGVCVVHLQPGNLPHVFVTYLRVSYMCSPTSRCRFHGPWARPRSYCSEASGTTLRNEHINVFLFNVYQRFSYFGHAVYVFNVFIFILGNFFTS